MKLRVLTYNIHKGVCHYSRQYILRELRQAIRAVDADVVFLQEVLGFHPGKHGSQDENEIEIETQFEYLADEIWSHFAYGKNAIYSSGHHGNAILSKFPIAEFANVDISTNRLERRGLLHATVQFGSALEDCFHAVNLHLDLREKGRSQQIERVIGHVQDEVPMNQPLIVAGDFNDWRARLTDKLELNLSLREAGLNQLGRHAATFPSWLPILPLDRVYTRGFKVQTHVVLAGKAWAKMSDHAAVVVDLQLENARDRPVD